MSTSTTRRQARVDARGVREGAATAAPSSAPTTARHATARKQLTAWAFLAPIVIYLVLFYAYPLYTNLDLSFRDYTLGSFITGDAQWAGLDNYRQVLTDKTFGTALWNTFIFTGASLLFQYAFGLALAVFFYRKFPLSSTLRALFLVPWLLPLLVSASTWAWMLNSESGIVNTALSWVGLDPIYWLTSPDWSLTAVLITNIWIGIPFNLVLLYAGLQSIPTELYEASAIDGAGPWRTLLVDHVPAVATGQRDHGPARSGLHAQGVRHHLGHDARRSWRLVRHPRDLVLSARIRRRVAATQPCSGRRKHSHTHCVRFRDVLRPRTTKGAEPMKETRKIRTTISRRRAHRDHAVSAVLDGQRLAHAA